MPDLTATSVLDPLVDGWAKEAGLPTEQLSNILGSDIIGGLVGVPLDMFLTPLGSKIAALFLGAAGLLFGTYTMKGQGRAQVDTVSISSRVLTEFLDASPQLVKDIQRNISDLIDGGAEGRWDKAAYAVFRNPRELKGLLPPPPAAPKKKEAPATKEQLSTKQPPQSKETGIVMKL